MSLEKQEKLLSALSFISTMPSIRSKKLVIRCLALNPAPNPAALGSKPTFALNFAPTNILLRQLIETYIEQA